MPAAVMREFCPLMRLVPSTDPRWGTVSAWQQYAQVWASVLPAAGTSAGTEQVVNQGAQTLVNYVVVTRYRADTTSKDRIIYRGQPLEILSVVDTDGTRSTLTIQARQFPGVQ